MTLISKDSLFMDEGENDYEMTCTHITHANTLILYIYTTQINLTHTVCHPVTYGGSRDITTRDYTHASSQSRKE